MEINNCELTYTFIVLQLVDSLWQGLIDQQIKTPMGITAENLAKQYEITREQCDAYVHFAFLAKPKEKMDYLFSA